MRLSPTMCEWIEAYALLIVTAIIGYLPINMLCWWVQDLTGFGIY